MTTAWRKSEFSETQSCVEVASAPGRVLVRDSKNPDRPHLTLDRAAFAALVHAIKEHR